MKVASTLLLTTLCCASAFGFHGTASKALKKIGGTNKVPMVQPIDLHSERSSAVTVSGLLSFWLRIELSIVGRTAMHQSCLPEGAKLDERFFSRIVSG